MLKVQKNRKHARKRADQRYGTYLTNQDFMEITQQIMRKEYDTLEKQTNTRDKISFSYNSKKYSIIWDRTRNSIVTFLVTSENPNMLEFEKALSKALGSGKMTLIRKCMA